MENKKAGIDGPDQRSRSAVTGSKELIRDINSHLVLESIVNNGPVSRADLAKRLGLTKATISAIVQILIDEQLIIEIGSKDTYVGRKPILLKFNQLGGHVISVDLSIHSITILVSDLRGEHCKLEQYSNTSSGQEIISTLIILLKQVIEDLPATRHGVIGISLGIHGTVHQNRVEFSPYYDLEELDLAAQLEHEFSVPVYIENEANLSAQGERGFYYNLPNLINISIHSGLGMGIILNDHLYTGIKGYAGEFGHTIIEPDGRPCPCGNYGCIEQYTSERALLMELAKRKGVEKIKIDDLVSLYNKNDSDAQAIIEEFIRYISIGINNVLNIFNPNIIVLNSSFTIYIPDLIPQIHRRLKNRMSSTCRIEPSKLQDTAILLGGVCVCIKNFLGIDFLKLNHKKLNLE